MSTAFGDLLATPMRSGFTIPASTRGHGVRMLNMGELFRHPRVPDIEMTRVTPPSASDERAYLAVGDLMFARRSLTLEGAGKCAIIGAVGEPTTWESSIIRARVDRSLASPEYLFYYFRSPAGRRTVETIVEQVAAAGIRLSELAKLRVPTPALAEQQAIAEVLGALDDKIAANTALAATAWSLLETEFRSIQSGAKATGTRLGDVISLEYGKPLPASSRMPGNVAVVGSGGISDFHAVPLVEASGVVVGRKGTAGSVHWVSGPHFPIDTTFYVRPSRTALSQPYLYFLLRGLRLNEMNSDSAVPGLNRAEALALPVRVPADERLATFATRAAAVINMVDSTALESRTLAATRDTLLPQLMSGRLRVRDARPALSAIAP